jgi:hypothetical protein
LEEGRPPHPLCNGNGNGSGNVVVGVVVVVVVDENVDGDERL